MSPPSWIMVIASQGTMPTSLPGLIPVHATEKSFQQALWKCHLPIQEAIDPTSSAWQSSPSHRKHHHPRSLSPTSTSVPLTGPHISSPRQVHGHCTWQPSLKMPLYPVVLSLLPFSGLHSGHVHPYLQAWPLHSSSVLCYWV